MPFVAFSTGGLAINAGPISLSNQEVLEGLPAGTAIAAINISAPGTWSFSVLAANDAGDRVVVDGAALEATSTPFDYAVAPSYVIRLRAQRAEDGLAVEEAFTLVVIEDLPPAIPTLAFELPQTGVTPLAIPQLADNPNNEVQVAVADNGIPVRFLTEA